MSNRENLLIGQKKENGGVTSIVADDIKQNEITFEINGLLQNENGSLQQTTNDSEPEYGSSTFERFKTDRKFRHRLLHTACVGWSMVALGWRVSLIGPTFPDLRLIMDEDLSTASWLFTAWALGGMVGSVLGGAVYDRFNKIILYVTLMFGLAASAAVTPWSQNFPLMFTLHLLGGGFGSAMDAVGTTDIVHVWRHEGGPYMQAVHFGFSLGAIVSPFIAGPFLAPKIAIFRPPETIDINLLAIPLAGNVTDVLSNSNSSFEPFGGLNKATGDIKMNGFMKKDGNMTFDLNDTLTESLPPPLFEYGDSRIYVPYSISTCVSITAMCSFIILYCFYGNPYEYALVVPVVKASGEKATTKDKTLTKRLQIVFILLQAGMFLLYFIIEKTFIGYLMTFLIGIGWSKQQGATATSVMFIAFASGRFSGIFIVKFITQTLTIFTFIGILGIGIVGLWIGVEFHVNALIWASVAAFGLGMSIMFASIFSWLSENVIKLTGRITSILFIVSAFGTMLFPLLTGFLMSSISYQWYLYLMFILVCSKAVLFTIVSCVYKCTTGKKLR